MSSWCKTIGELDDFIAFVVLKGPNRFPVHRNMDMEKALAQIKEGIENCKQEIGDHEKSATLVNFFTEANDFFMNENVVEGKHKLQELAEVLTENRCRRD